RSVVASAILRFAIPWFQLLPFTFMTWASLAVAQTAPRPAAAPATTAPSLSATPEQVAPAPEVSDPMLGPVPPAAKVIHSWDEALTLIRTRSPDYATGYQEIRKAEAQSRIALAAVLPTLNGQVSYTHQFLQAHFILATPDSSRPSGIAAVP